MRKNQIKLWSLRNHAKDLEEARFAAKKRNLELLLNAEILELLVSPDSDEKYTIINQNLVCQSGKSVPIVNGIPDFTIFSETALDEKKEQAEFHDNEEISDPFDEMVFRPFNHNLFFAKTWLKHLSILVDRIESISGEEFKNFSILNCGCGGGFEAQYFASKGANVLGFDISQLRAEAASSRFALNNMEGIFYRGDASVLPFYDNSFDLVIYHDSLHHVPIEEIPKAIREAARVAKNYVILSEANDSPIRLILEAFGKSTSIEKSGNYTFRFRRILIQYWCNRYNLKLLLYETFFDKKEHRPNYYKNSIIGPILYYIIFLFGKILKPFGNEALIIMGK